MQGEVTGVNDDGTVTVRLHGFDYPITTRPEHLQLVQKRKPGLSGHCCRAWTIGPFPVPSARSFQHPGSR